MAAGLNLAIDLATLILPLTELYKLSMTMRKKLQILSMFCVGFLFVFLYVPPLWQTPFTYAAVH